MILKKGDLCKHFKGKNLQEKNIYEVLETGVNYSGDASERKNICKRNERFGSRANSRKTARIWTKT